MTSAITLVDVVADPARAMDSLRGRATIALPMLALFVLFVIGSLLQLPAVAHIEASSSPAAVVTTSDVWARVATLGQWLQWVLAFVFVLIGLLIGTGIAALGAMLGGGEVRFGRLFGAMISIAVPCLGLYVLTTGVVALVAGPSTFVHYDDLAKVVPSLLTIVPFAKAEFLRGLLASVNPFSIWAFVLYRMMFIRVSSVSVAVSTVLAVALVVAGALAQGLLAAIST